MLVMVVFFIAFRWIHLSTPLIRLFLLVLILLLMPTLNFLPVWFALSLLRFRLPSRLPMMFILWMVAMMVVIIRSEERFSRNAETDLVCRLLLEKKKRFSQVLKDASDYNIKKETTDSGASGARSIEDSLGLVWIASPVTA